MSRKHKRKNKTEYVFEKTENMIKYTEFILQNQEDLCDIINDRVFELEDEIREKIFDSIRKILLSKAKHYELEYDGCTYDYETKTEEIISAQVCNQCGKAYLSRSILKKNWPNLTEAEVNAAGCEVVENEVTEIVLHTFDSPGCVNYRVDYIKVPTTHGETTWVVDTLAYTQCSVCGATK